MKRKLVNSTVDLNKEVGCRISVNLARSSLAASGRGDGSDVRGPSSMIIGKEPCDKIRERLQDPRSAQYKITKTPILI